MGLWCLLLSNDNYLLNILSQPNQPQLDIFSQPNQPQLNILSQPNQPQHDILSQPKIRILPPPDKDFDKQRNGWDISPLCGIFLKRSFVYSLSGAIYNPCFAVQCFAVVVPM